MSTRSAKSTMSKLLSQVFSQVDNVVWDLASNSTGVKRSDGIYTLANDNTVELNPFDAMSMSIPAFSQLTPVDQVKRGDVLILDGKPAGWITDVNTTKAKAKDDAPAKTMLDDVPAKTTLTSMTFAGHETRFRPKTVKMLGMSGVTVVRSLFNFNPSGSGEASSSPFGDMSAMLPLMMLSENGAGSSIDMKSMMLMSMMSGGGNMFSDMNPMMLMMLMGDDAGFLNQ